MRKDDDIRFEPYDHRFGTLCSCAVRYAIGRCTYVPSMIIEMLTPLLPKLDDQTLNAFRKDIQGAKGLGSDSIDAPGWIMFMQDIDRELERRRRELGAVDAYM